MASENNVSLIADNIKAPRSKITITQIDPTHEKRYLGLILSCSEDDTQEFHHRFNLAQQLAGKIMTTPLSYTEAHTVYRERWQASFNYCLPITQFTKKQCEKSSQPSTCSSFPGWVIIDMPCAVIAGPYQFGGYNFTTYWHEQHIQNRDK